MTAAEFSRPVRVDTLGEAPRRLDIAADAAERTALARRFGLVAISRLAAELSLRREADEIAMQGIVNATVTQACIVTGEPIEGTVATAIDVRFRPHPAGSAEDEIELGEGELDVVFYDGAAVDAGEAVAETLSLALDPYPRAPGAEQALRDAGVKSEEEAGPFAALASLRDKLKP